MFKIIQELLEPSKVKGKSKFQLLMDMLPENHKAKWLAGTALNSGDQAMASVLSTTLSRLNSFIDSELEQVLCFDTGIDMELFCEEKSAIYLTLPEEDATKHFLISLIIQQIYRELLTIADGQGGALNDRVIIYADEGYDSQNRESGGDIFGRSFQKNFDRCNYPEFEPVGKNIWKRRG